jgi:hypothetical protein
MTKIEVVRAMKRTRLILLFPVAVLLHCLILALVIAPVTAWRETLDEFRRRWHGGYGG